MGNAEIGGNFQGLAKGLFRFCDLPTRQIPHSLHIQFVSLQVVNGKVCDVNLNLLFRGHTQSPAYLGRNGPGGFQYRCRLKALDLLG